MFFRDVKYIVQVILMFGIFFTPDLLRAVPSRADRRPLMMLNPLAPLVEGLRLAVVEHHNLMRPLMAVIDGAPIAVWQPWYLLYSGTWAVFGLLGAWLMFHRLEFVYPEYV